MDQFPFYHSKTFVPKAHINPRILKLDSKELHNARPIVIGIIEQLVQWPVFSPNIIRLIITVNNGDDALTVATNETTIYFSANKPKITVAQRNAPIKIISWNMLFTLGLDELLCVCVDNIFIMCICIKLVNIDKINWFIPLIKGFKKKTHNKLD